MANSEGRLPSNNKRETSEFLGACRIIRLEKTPDAIREQRGPTNWTPVIQFTRAILSRCSNAERHTVV